MFEAFRYRPFGILRFILALMVLVQHFNADIAPPFIKQIIFPYAPGNIAVLCFFILSGFIICEAYHYNYQERPFAYLQNRFMRIVPSYWAALTISIVIHYILLQYDGHLWSLDCHEISLIHFDALNLVKNFLLIISPVHLNVTTTEYPFIPYAWALQTEMMFYLAVFCVGVSYPFLCRYVMWPQGYWLALVGFLGIAAGIAVQMHDLPGQLAYGSYFAFGGSLFFFLSGFRKAIFVLIPSFIQMLWQFHTYGIRDFMIISANRSGQLIIFSIILIIICILMTLRVQHTKIDKWIGEFSYPLYLNHYVIAVIILNTVSDFSIKYLVAGLVGSLLLTWLMFWLVDKPLIKVRRAIRQKDPSSGMMISSDP